MDLSARCRTAIVAVAILLTAAGPASRSLDGRVVGVTDGDTLTVLTQDKVTHKVRLVEIDAPESGQAWGARAKSELSTLAHGRLVRIRVDGQDRYGRVLGRVFVDGADVNAELVRRGAAWAYLEYLKDNRLVALEGQARAARRGLWSMPADQIVAPWIWRQHQRTDAAPRQQAAPAAALTLFGGASGGGFTCGRKRYCREMASCAEARFHLQRCGLSSLDGDGDGRPCEALCSPS